MIGSIALLCALATAATAPSRVHVPRIEMPDFDFDVPEVDVPLPSIDFGDLPSVDFDVESFRKLARMRSDFRDFFRGGALAMRDEDEDEDEGDKDRDKQRQEGRWYRDRTWKMFGDDEAFEDQKPTARSEGKGGSATLGVKGPVTFRLRVQAGEAEIVPSDKQQVAVTIHGVPKPRDVQLLQFGERVEPRIGGSSQLRHGAIRVELPKGSSLDFSSTSGDLAVENIGGDVRVRTMSGDVKIAGARNADVQSISGDVKVGTTGPRLRLHIVSGNAAVTTVDPAVQLNFESASGNLEWAGVCAKGCYLSTQTVSGQIKLQPDSSKSSFQLSYASHSGDLRDDLNLQVKRAPKKKHDGMGGWLEAVYGKGEGVIECDAFSGDVIVSKK
jgi:Putative adhesin